MVKFVQPYKRYFGVRSQIRLKPFQNTEFDGIRRGPPKSEFVAFDLHLVFDAKLSYVGLNGLQHRNLHLKLYQNNGFDGFRRGLPKSESVAGDLHLTSDANESYVGLSGLQHHNLRLELY